MKKITTLLLTALLIGCGEREFTSNAELFKAKHSNVAKHYVTLSETSFEFAAMMLQNERLVIRGIADEIEKRISNPEELRKYVASLRELNQEDFKWNGRYAEVSGALGANDSVYFYEYINGDIRDSGTLILRNGNIVYRDAIAVTDETELIDKL